jgi:hypothetical protein
MARPIESIHAERRGPVRWTKGARTGKGTLVYWPVPGRGRRGNKAIVITAGGAHITVAPEDVELLDLEQQGVGT